MTQEVEGACNGNTKKIKIWKCSHCSPVTIFSLYMNVYKHMYGDFTENERQTSQHQDVICSEAGEGHGCKETRWQTLRSAVWQCSRSSASQPSEETSGAFPLTKKTFSSAFLELMTAGKRTLGPYRHRFVPNNDLCRLAITIVSK